jgi:hypothetical protein
VFESEKVLKLGRVLGLPFVWVMVLRVVFHLG